MAHDGLLQYQPNVFQRGGLLPFGLDRARGLLSRNVSPDASAAPSWYGGLLPPFPKDRTGMTDPLDPLIGLPTGEGSGLPGFMFPPEVHAQLDREQANMREMLRINSLTPGQPKYSVMEIAGAQPTMTRMLPEMMFGAGITPYVGRLAGALRGMPQEKMTAEQAQGYLGKTPGGVSADELAYTGVRGLLEEGRPVTRTGLLEQVKAQPLELRDVVKGYDREKAAVYDRYRNAKQAMADTDVSSPNWNEVTAQFKAAERAMGETVPGWGRGATPDELAGIQPPKFSEWQLPGGKNYQETLITMPPKHKSTKYWDVRPSNVEGEWAIYENVPYAGYSERMHSFQSRADAEQSVKYMEGALARGDIKAPEPPAFTGGHYDEPNVLAHARHNERTLTNGDKTLFIEEIQSDWHQKGRKEGYQPPGSITREGGRMLGVPDAPFKKNWHDLTFRRMAHEAAKRDMDTISWTPGQVQADRYDLSKHLTSVEVRPLKDGSGKLTVYGYKGNSQVITQHTTPENLSNIIGKDLADKALKDGAVNDAVNYQGVDLKVGGEGMKNFYDKMIRKSADKLGKKYGVKTEVREISGEGRQRLGHEVLDPDGQPYDAFNTREAAEQVARDMTEGGRGYGGTYTVKEKPPVKVWSLPLTPELKKALLKGGVTFGVAGVAAMDQDNETLGLLKKPVD